MTKRANGEGTMYQEASGRWAAQTFVRTPEGRRKRKTLRAATQRDVQRLLRETVQQVEAGVALSSRRPPTLREYGRSWLSLHLPAEVALGTLSPRTLDNYTTIWTTHIEPALGDVRLDRLTVKQVREWLAMKATCRSVHTGEMIKPRSLQAMHGVLRRALRDAVRDELIPRNVAALVAAPRVPKSKVEPLSKADAQKILSTAAQDEFAGLWVLLLSLGLRIGEALALRWEDVDLDAGTVNIHASVGRLRDAPQPDGSRPTRLNVGGTKTPASTYLLPLPAFSVAALRQHRRLQTAQRVAATSWVDPGLVFASERGTYLDSRNVLRRLKSLAASAGVERNVWLHLLRHSAASFLLAQGVPLERIKDLLRHTRLATTSDLYAHLSHEMRVDVATAMDGFLRTLTADEVELPEIEVPAGLVASDVASNTA